MADLTPLQKKIDEFEKALSDLKDATRDAHAVLKDMKKERKEVEKLFSADTKRIVHEQVDEVVSKELLKITPEIQRLTNQIYTKVGTEIDKIIAISLGKDFTTRFGNKKDLRPVLGAKLREWILEIIEEEEVDG